MESGPRPHAIFVYLVNSPLIGSGNEGSAHVALIISIRLAPAFAGRSCLGLSHRGILHNS